MLRTAAVALAALAGLASADTIDFVVYSDNAGSVPGIHTSAELTATASTFTITLSNNSTSGYISNFYIEMGSALSTLGAATINNTPGISFSQGGSPGSPGGGIQNTTGGDWAGNFFSMHTNTPQPQNNAINVGESLSVTFAHDGSFSLSDLIAAIQSHDIRLVQHYRAYGDDGESAWLQSNLAVVPLPPAAFAGLGVLGVMGGLRAARRRARA